MSQSVILVSDVPGLGQVGDQKTVKDGYARNYLLPRHLAVIANTNAVKRAERQKGKITTEREKLLGKAKEVAERLTKVGLSFERPMGQGGRLFGSVTPYDIAGEFSRQGMSVEKKSILMSAPLKTPGDHVIRVRIHSQVVVDIPVKVIGIEVNQRKGESIESDEEPDYTPEEKPA